MQPVNNLNTLPSDLVLFISNGLENSVEIVSLSGTCKALLGIFTNVQENALFKSFRPDLRTDSLYSKIFQLKSMNFICSPCASITISLFRKTTALLSNFFPTCQLGIIEASLRNTLKRVKQDGFSVLAKEFSNITPNHPKVEELKPRLKIELTNQKAEIDAKLLELCGPNGNDGTIDTAFKKMQSAEAVLNIAKQALQKCNEHNFNDIYNEFIASTIASQNAAETFSDLSAERDNLAKWTLGTLTKGKLLVVTDKLANLDTVAVIETRRMGLFYNELNEDVTSANYKTRFIELHEILQ